MSNRSRSTITVLLLTALSCTNALAVVVRGSVYGGGNKANVQTNSTVNISGGQIQNDVFGGGNMASVNGNTVVDVSGSCSIRKIFGGGNDAGVDGNTTTTLHSGTVTNGVYGGCNSQGTVGGSATVTLLGGTIGSNETNAFVHGGGYGHNTGISGNVYVYVGTNENPGNVVIYGDVYGGSALGQVNTTVSDSTNVMLYGGTIHGDAYGGGLGYLSSTPGDSIQAWVNGKVNVTLTGTKFHTTYDYLQNGLQRDTIPLSGRIFGANNQYGSPRGPIKVLINSTVPYEGVSHRQGVYEVQGVYGGGNLASYQPTNPNTQALVILDGCEDISIEQVYGGGNAAPVPASKVIIYGTYEVGQLFGGGNGKDKIKKQGTYQRNPGADVGIDIWDGTPVDPGLFYQDPNHDKNNVRYVLYGDTTNNPLIGMTEVQVYGGHIHYVFGGSNTLGDVMREALVILGDENLQTCIFDVDEVYGGANEAYMSGTAMIEMNCIDGLKEIFGGSRKADVMGNIVLNITGGEFERVFGGNNQSGNIYGSITINIEQTGCLPIHIHELYAGGFIADYSVYGYNSDGTVKTDGQQRFEDPVINVRSCLRIDTIYGGGYQADVIGSPTINIDMVRGWVNGHYTEQNSEYRNAHLLQDIGVVGGIFGGGNEADVIGDTYINIGTRDEITLETILENDQETNPLNQSRTQAVQDINITGNVYGGGNKGHVSGKTHVNIGK